MLTNTMKYKNAEWFLSTTQKHAAKNVLNTIMLTNAKHAKNGFATNIANMFQNTIGNMYVEMLAAKILALSSLAIHAVVNP